MSTDYFGPSFHLEALTALLPSTWTVADIGTGTGYLLPHLAAAFATVHAIDPVAEMRSAAQARVAAAGLSNVHFHAGTASAIPLADGALDLCIASLVLHHEPQPAQALMELHRVLRPGGKLLIIEQAAHQEQAFHELMQDHWWGFDAEALVAEATTAGFAAARWRMLSTAEPTNHAGPQPPQLFVLRAERPMSRNRTETRVSTPRTEKSEPSTRTETGANATRRFHRTADDDGWRQY
jgi:ArsR family transcriptional regulator